MRRLWITTLAAMLALTLTAPVANAGDGGPHGFVRDHYDYGFFYGYFTGALLFVGGPAEGFVDAACGPADPGAAPMRLFFRGDDQVQLRVDAHDQPAYLYWYDGDAIEFLDENCAAGSFPEPDGMGSVRLKVRDTVTFEGAPSPDALPLHVDVRNSVVGSITTTDGTWWRVRAWADLELVRTPDDSGLMPAPGSGSPADFQSLELHRTRR